MQTQLNDELLRIPELNNWCLMAGDGHYQKAAIFDKKTKADTSERKPSKSPVGHGTKVLWLWDKACIDYEFWLKAKHQKGVYFATLEKKNSLTIQTSAMKGLAQTGWLKLRLATKFDRLFMLILRME